MAREAKTLAGDYSLLSHTPTQNFIGKLLVASTATWANSAGQYTEKTIDLTGLLTTYPDVLDSFLMVMYNPSTVSNVSACTTITKPINGTSRVIYYSATSTGATWTAITKATSGITIVPANLAILKLGTATAYGIQLRNDTALGGGDGFTAAYEVYI